MYENLFNELWEQYPRKEGRQEALRHFKATVKTDQTAKDIKVAFEKYTQYCKLQNIDYRYIKTGGTWFYNWKDWVDFEPKNSQKKYEGSLLS